jgi:hypothetical protein
MLRGRSFIHGLIALCLAAAIAAAGSAPSLAAGWSGKYSVYHAGAFSYQHLDYTCVGASVQMMLNMINGTSRHSASAQKTYWQYGRDHSKYKSSNNGVDPVGWVAALEHFGAGDYAINVASRYQSGLKTLAERMRATGRPIGLFVDHGGHAWVMSGFASTADPAATNTFKVTSVQVEGPLYPDGTLNGKSYDPAPGTWLSASALSNKFNRMRWARAPQWNDHWIAVVPD